MLADKRCLGCGREVAECDRQALFAACKDRIATVGLTNQAQLPWGPATRVDDEAVHEMLLRVNRERRADRDWFGEQLVNQFCDCLRLAITYDVPERLVVEALRVVAMPSTRGLEVFDALAEPGFVIAMAVLRDLGVPHHVVMDFGDRQALTLLSYSWRDGLHEGLRRLLEARGYQRQYVDLWVQAFTESLNKVRTEKEVARGTA